MDPAIRFWIERIKRIGLFRLKKKKDNFRLLTQDKLLQGENLNKFKELFRLAFPSFDWRSYINNNTQIPQRTGLTKELEIMLFWLTQEDKNSSKFISPVVRKITVPENSSYEWDLVIVAIFKDEAARIREWLDFHIKMGVKHFFLYDNESGDNFKEILRPYEEKKIVSLKNAFNKEGDHIYEQAQRRAYEEAKSFLKGKAKWTLFLDLDEFIFCVDGTTLPQFLNRYEEYPGVSVNWVNFGTSGVQELEEGQYQTLAVTHRFPDSFFHNSYVKTFLRLEFVQSCGLHNAVFIDNLVSVDPELRPVPSNLNLFAPISQVRINHYWMRSEGHKHRKFQRANYPAYSSLNSEQRDNLHPDRNAVQDTTIIPYLDLRHQERDRFVSESV